MNTSRTLLQRLALLAGGWLICLPTGYAAPGGGGAAVGAASAGGAAGGGGHAASAAPAASGHVSSGGGGVAPAAGPSSGFRSSFGGTAGASGYQRSGFAGSGGRTLPGIAANPNILSYNNGQSARIAQAYAAARVNNAWSDPAESRGATASGISRYGGYAVSGQRNGLANNARPGNNLSPGASGYVPTRPASGQFQRGRNGIDRSRGGRRYYYNNFPYAVYYPYLYGGYGYGAYGDPGYYDGTADYAGLTPDSDIANPGTPNFSDTPNNYYSYSGPDQGNPNAGPDTSTQSLPDAPAVGPQAPPTADQSPGAAQGPDSLVEAVQDELSRRGYLDGKPAGVYTPATKEAIRRFQTDNHLPATGRINEATLHALHLD